MINHTYKAKSKVATEIITRFAHPINYVKLQEHKCYDYAYFLKFLEPQWSQASQLVYFKINVKSISLNVCRIIVARGMQTYKTRPCRQGSSKLTVNSLLSKQFECNVTVLHINYATTVLSATDVSFMCVWFFSKRFCLRIILLLVLFKTN